MKLAVLNNNGVIPDLSDEFEILGEDDMMSADAILMWNDIVPIHHIMCREARIRGIRTFVVQHGFMAWADYKKCLPMADYFLTWGKQDTKMAIKYGWDKNRVIRTGSSLLKYKISVMKNSDNIVSFAPIKEYYLAEKEFVETTNLNVWNKLKSIEGINPKVKLIKNYSNIDKYSGCKVVTLTSDTDHLKKTAELIGSSSCVVCQHESTYEMLACLHDVPIVSIKNEFMSFPCSHETTLDNLENTVKFAMLNPSVLRHERRQTLENYFGIPETDNPKQAIIDTIYAYA